MNSNAFTPPDWYARLEELLAPLPGDEPCGPSLRYDPALSAIRRAREADDASLPLGDWERPLKSADWSAVQTLGVALLAGRSKDLQVACWVLEAATVQQQLAGLHAGMELLHGLIERHWDKLHPRLGDDGDCDARVAPLSWLNETLPRVLRLEIRLMPLPDRKPPRLTLDEWERQGRGGEDPDAGDPDRALPARDELLRLAGQPAALAYLQQLRDQLDRVDAAWSRLSTLLDERLGQEGPGMGHVASVLRLMTNAVEQLLAGRGRPAQTSESFTEDPMPSSEPSRAWAGRASGLPTGLVLDSRAAAYLMLEQVADYLQRTEPHSPSPYLIRRAIHWGRLALPELMQEVLREEGDLNRLFTVLGLAPRQDQ